jgi:hypothetical protein
VRNSQIAGRRAPDLPRGPIGDRGVEVLWAGEGNERSPIKVLRGFMLLLAVKDLASGSDEKAG